MSSEDNPSNPLQGKSQKLLATLSEHSGDKVTIQARKELSEHLEASASSRSIPPGASAKASQEVTEATTKFLDGVDVITETLILILGKFKMIIWRTTLGMGFGFLVLLTCLLVARQTHQTSLAQEASARKVSELTMKFEEALRRLDKIQQSASSTEQKVDAARQTAEAKPSIEIVPNQDKPGEAKVVIRQNSRPQAPSSGVLAGSGAAKPPASVLEIPIQLPVPTLAMPKKGQRSPPPSR
jgi:hypothetical protein